MTYIDHVLKQMTIVCKKKKKKKGRLLSFLQTIDYEHEDENISGDLMGSWFQWIDHNSIFFKDDEIYPIERQQLIQEITFKL